MEEMQMALHKLRYYLHQHLKVLKKMSKNQLTGETKIKPFLHPRERNNNWV